MGWLWLLGSLKSWVSFAKEPYKWDDILQERRIILRSLLIVATPLDFALNYAHVNTCRVVDRDTLAYFLWWTIFWNLVIWDICVSPSTHIKEITWYVFHVGVFVPLHTTIFCINTYVYLYFVELSNMNYMCVTIHTYKNGWHNTSRSLSLSLSLCRSRPLSLSPSLSQFWTFSILTPLSLKIKEKMVITTHLTSLSLSLSLSQSLSLSFSLARSLSLSLLYLALSGFKPQEKRAITTRFTSVSLNLSLPPSLFLIPGAL